MLQDRRWAEGRGIGGGGSRKEFGKGAKEGQQGWLEGERIERGRREGKIEYNKDMGMGREEAGYDFVRL